MAVLPHIATERPNKSRDAATTAIAIHNTVQHADSTNEPINFGFRVASVVSDPATCTLVALCLVMDRLRA